jgi:hypothetical protein
MRSRSTTKFGSSQSSVRCLPTFQHKTFNILGGEEGRNGILGKINLSSMPWRWAAVEVKLHVFLIRIFKESSQPHVPVTLSTEKRAQYPLHRTMGVSQRLPEQDSKDKNLYLCREANPVDSTCSQALY